MSPLLPYRVLLITLMFLMSVLVAPAFSETLAQTIQSAYAFHKSKAEPFTARNVLEAQSESVRKAQQVREIARKAASVYSELYFAERLHLIAKGQFQFVVEQEKFEQQRLKQGLSTRANLGWVKTHKLHAQKKMLAAQKGIEISERAFQATVGRPAKDALQPFNIGKEISGENSVRNGINLSHPQLMQMAYHAKNVRRSYEVSKLNPIDPQKLENLAASVSTYEALFEKQLQQITFDTIGIYKNYVWAEKQIAIERKQIDATRALFQSVIEARKHGLKTTPEVLAVFDEAIEARIDFLNTGKQKTQLMISLLSEMGQLVPLSFVHREPLVWQKKTVKISFNKLAEDRR